MNILVVDDDIDVQTFLEHFLRAEGYTVHSAGDGREALCKLKEKIHNMVFLDLKMPDLNGVETLKYIKEHYPGIVVVVITGEKYCDKEEKVREIGGVFDIIHKPFKLDTVRQVIKDSIGKSS